MLAEIVAAAMVLIAFLAIYGATRARALGLDPARVLLAFVLDVALVARYRRRWLEAVERLAELDARHEELRDRYAATTATAARESRNVELERQTVRELQEQIAELCVDIAVMEGARDAELASRAAEIAAGTADALRRRRHEMLAKQEGRAMIAHKQAMMRR